MRNVAVFIESSTQYGRNMLQGVAQYAQLAGWRLHYEQGGLNREEPEWLRDWQGDGVITRAARMRFSPKLAAKGMAVIQWDSDSMGPRATDLPHTDEEAIGKLAATYFIGKGFRHFAFVGFHDAVYSNMRQEAFRASVEQAGHPPVQDFITSRAKGPYADQEEDARQFLGSLPNPCAVFCGTDERAAQILGLAADCGCAVPEQLSVLGVDNDPLLCQIAHPSLSSIDTNASGAGFAVAERLDAMMHKRKLAPVQFVKPTGVVERVSTGMEAVDDPHLRRALAFMRRSIRKPLKVDDVAQAAGVSRRSLEYRFREQLQTSVAVFMRRQKVEEIKKLLLQTDYTLDKIAESVGIELQHLHALIHKVDGISPGKFRRANAKKAFDQIV